MQRRGEYWSIASPGSFSGVGIAIGGRALNEAIGAEDTELIIVGSVIGGVSLIGMIASFIVGKLQSNAAEETLLEAMKAFGIERGKIPELTAAAVLVDKIATGKRSDQVMNFLAFLRAYYPLVLFKYPNSLEFANEEDLEARYGDDVRLARKHRLIAES